MLSLSSICLVVQEKCSKMSKTKENREKIITKFIENPLLSHREIARQLKLPKTTVNNVIKRYKETKTIERRPGGGRKSGVVNQSLATKIERYVRKNPGATERKIAQKFKVSKSWVHKVLRLSGLKAYKVQKTANCNDQQAARAKTRARKLYDEYIRGKKRCVAMDDGTYVIADFKQLPGRGFYRADFRFGVLKKFKYQGFTKFPKKYMVWQAICTCGKRSAAFIAKGNMKTDDYIRECLQKRLLPFVRKHNVNPLFWPDLASIHYSKKTMEWYKTNKVEIVPIAANPPNCPQLRPVETYWALIKQKLRQSQKIALNYLSFAKLWASATKKVPDSVVKRLMNGLGGKINQFSRTPIDN